MPRPAFAPLLSLAAALLLLVVGAAAAPASAAVPVFRRSCAECDAAEFCELAVPGTPDGHVACVAYAGNKHLYRRYAPAYNSCPGRVCPGGVPTPGTDHTAETCAAACAGYTYATYSLVAPKSCGCTDSCTVAISHPDFNVLALGGASCPSPP